MDFRQSTQPAAPRPAAPSAPTGSRETNSRRARDTKWFNVLNIIVLIGVAVLVALVALVFTRGGVANEAKYVDSDQYQAVFLNNGQVYFGHVQSLNPQYVRMTDIYYLTQNGSSSNSNYSLVKLGCQQIHDPLDQMVINRDQVTFWENLNDSGKVVSSIKQFQKQNPNGPDCSQVSTQTQASPSTGTQGTSNPSTNNSSSTTGSGSSKTTKP